MNSAQDLLPTLRVYAGYKGVSGLGINTSKSTALCINTSDNVQEGLQELGICTTAHSKHLGLYLGESRDFFWRRKCEGETIQKRRGAARPRITSDLHMGGLNVPTFQTLAEGFHLNLLKRIYKRELFPHKYPESHLPGILARLLREKGRPSLQVHIAHLGPTEWVETAAAIASHNKLLGRAFQAGTHQMRLLEKDEKYWQLTPIKGHSKEGPL